VLVNNKAVGFCLPGVFKRARKSWNKGSLVPASLVTLPTTTFNRAPNKLTPETFMRAMERIEHPSSLSSGE
jgi:hypothetical protein